MLVIYKKNPIISFCSICAITFLVINSTKQNVCSRAFGTTWRNKIEKIVNVGTGGNHMAGQSFGTVNALYLRNGLTQIHQIYRKFLAHNSAQNRRKIFSKFRDDGQRETPPNNKMNVEKFKSDQKIWNIFTVKCCTDSRIEHFF